MFGWLKKRTGPSFEFAETGHLYESEFSELARLLGRPIAKELTELYKRDWNELACGRQYLDLIGFRHEATAKKIRLVPLTVANYHYLLDRKLHNNRNFVPIGDDDFGNFYLMDNLTNSVYFLSVDSDTGEPFLLYESFGEFMEGVQWPQTV